MTTTRAFSVSLPRRFVAVVAPFAAIVSASMALTAPAQVLAVPEASESIAVGDFVEGGPLAPDWSAPTDDPTVGELGLQVVGSLVGGSPAASGAFPWMTYVQTENGFGQTAQCGGSLIAPLWVLTAAHCLGEGAPTVSAEPVPVVEARSLSSRFGPTVRLLDGWPDDPVGSDVLANISVSSPIINGATAGQNEFPWASFLRVMGADGSVWTCGGSLVAPRWILTAAHCVDDAIRIGTVTGQIAAPGASDVVFARSYVMDEGYDPSAFGVNDVALVELSEPNLGPTAQLAKPGDTSLYSPGTAATVAGWGLTSPGGNTSSILLKGTGPVRARSECVSAFALFDASTNVCAGYLTGEASEPIGSCSGDSGGPLLVPSGDQRQRIQIGIVSYGLGDCSSLTYPDVYMRVSHYYERITEHMATVPEFPAGSSFVALAPGRLLETRVGEASTVDGLFWKMGQRSAGSVTQLVVNGRGGVASNAAAVVLNVAVTGTERAGYLTVYPCGAPRPLASNLNYSAGQTIANTVTSKVGANGKVCIYTSGPTHLIADINGYFPAGSSFVALAPGRLLETRVGEASTVDGLFWKMGQRSAGSVTQLAVNGRGGVAGDAAAVVLNVAVTGTARAGYLTVYPCDAPRPLASNLNYSAGQTIANTVTSKVSAAGKVCIYTSGPTHLIADINGYFPAGSSFVALAPGRLLETRVGEASTVDGLFWKMGQRSAGSVTQLVVNGRGGVAGDAAAVVLNVAVTGTASGGYLTVYPCGAPRPLASNLNYSAGQTIANTVTSKVSANGKVCIYTSGPTHLIADINGYFAAGSSSPSPSQCQTSSRVSQLECDALVALYNSANGERWTKNAGWATDTDPCGWFGITCTAAALTELDLYGNQLTSSIPIELGNLANLTKLNLGRNSLTSSIPASLGNLTELAYLSLEWNKLTGIIPAELGNLGNLTTLSVSQNLLTGSIPIRLGNLTKLQSLALSFNPLTGSLPAELGNLKNLRSLFVYRNQLTGPIPPQLGNLTKLERLILDQPGLSGPIPTQLGNLTNLRELQLWGQLTGSIPASFGNLVNLSKLNVSRNRLSGDITAPMSALRAQAPVTSLELYQENDCLTVTDPTVATWIASFDSRWNEGCG